MQMYEIQPLIASIHRKYKESWEQARLVAYITAQVNSTKKLKPTDIISFCWDDTISDTSISNEDVQRLKEKAKQYTTKSNGRFSNQATIKQQ